jgi:hypothetical protein
MDPRVIWAFPVKFWTYGKAQLLANPSLFSVCRLCICGTYGGRGDQRRILLSFQQARKKLRQASGTPSFLGSLYSSHLIALLGGINLEIGIYGGDYSLYPPSLLSAPLNSR